jgi:hypothetical protein
LGKATSHDISYHRPHNAEDIDSEMTVKATVFNRQKRLLDVLRYLSQGAMAAGPHVAISEWGNQYWLKDRFL